MAAVAALFLLLSGFGAAAGDAEPRRVIAVTLATDAALRDQPDWRARVDNWMETVDTAYRETFGISWRVTARRDWSAHPHAMSAPAMLTSLEDAVPVTESDVVLGISGRRVVGTGASRTLYTHAVAALPPGVDDAAASVVIAHELAHLFGAWHVRNKRSVMYGLGARVLRFDAVTREVIELMRDYDFAGGVTRIEPAITARLGVLFAGNRGFAAIDPIALAHATRGVRLAAAGDRDQAVAALELAARRAPRCGECQRRLARMMFEDRDYDAAMTRIRLAMLAGVTPNRGFMTELGAYHRRAAKSPVYGCVRGDGDCADNPG